MFVVWCLLCVALFPPFFVAFDLRSSFLAVCYMLFVCVRCVCSSLFVVRGLLLVVCYVLSFVVVWLVVDCCLLLIVVCCLLLVGCFSLWFIGLLFVVCRVLCVGRCLLVLVC